MKQLILLLLTSIFFGCNQSTENTQLLKDRIDSLQAKINDSYKPGFGEFMSGIQVHHAKLWFAGQNQNWELADFEINEIKESLDGIKKYCADRPETKTIGIIEQPLLDVSNAIQEKNIKEFKNNFTILTATCNGCHAETNHGFNVITIPSTPPFSNQSFSLQNSK